MSDFSRNAHMVSRRDFLKISGAGVGATFIPTPLMSAGAFMMAGRIKTALLVPDFDLAPESASAFALKFQEMADSRFGVDLFSTGRGLTTQVMASARQALADGAKIIAAYINDNDADDLLALTESAGAGLLVINHGENMPRTSFASPRFARASRNQWAEHYRQGRAVASGDRVAMLTSFYESGFDTAYAFRMRVEDAGGTVLEHFVVRDMAGLNTALTATNRLGVDTVYAAFSGVDSLSVLGAWPVNLRLMSIGVTDMSDQFIQLGELAAAALNRWDGAKFAPDLAELPQNALDAAARRASVTKTGWLHPYMTL